MGGYREGGGITYRCLKTLFWGGGGCIAEKVRGGGWRIFVKDGGVFAKNLKRIALFGGFSGGRGGEGSFWGTKPPLRGPSK